MNIKKQMLRSAVSIFLAVAMVFTLVPESVYAQSNQYLQETQSTESIKAEYESNGCRIEYKTTSWVGNCAQIEIAITNHNSSAIKLWQLQLDYHSEIQYIHDAEIAFHSEGMYSINPLPDHSSIPVNQTIRFGFIAQDSRGIPSAPEKAELAGDFCDADETTSSPTPVAGRISGSSSRIQVPAWEPVQNDCVGDAPQRLLKQALSACKSIAEDDAAATSEPTEVPEMVSEAVPTVPAETVTTEPQITETPVAENTPATERQVTETTVPEQTAEPEPQITDTAVPEQTETPEPQITETPAPEQTAAPEPQEMATPVPEVTTTPVSETPEEPQATATEEPETAVSPSPEVTPSPLPEETEEPVEDYYVYNTTTLDTDLVCRNLFIVSGSLTVDGYQVTVKGDMVQSGGRCDIRNAMSLS